jgi:hypothetical protein
MRNNNLGYNKNRGSDGLDDTLLKNNCFSFRISENVKIDDYFDKYILLLMMILQCTDAKSSNDICLFHQILKQNNYLF